MGYRLEISEINYKACGGKLYGYEDEKELKSWLFLKSKGYIKGNEYWNYGFNPKIILDNQEFKEFIKLYNEDFNEYNNPKDIIIQSEDIKELLNKKTDKLLEWF